MSSAPHISSPASSDALRPATRAMLVAAALISLAAAGVATGAVANGAPAAPTLRQITR